MRTKIYSSQFVEHSYDENTGIFYTEWQEDSEDMLEFDFRHEVKAWLEASRKVKPRKILDICKNLAYPISPESQIWIAELLTPEWIRLGVKRYAQVLPKDEITRMSSEQLLLEFAQLPHKNRINFSSFESETEAQKWLSD